MFRNISHKMTFLTLLGLLSMLLSISACSYAQSLTSPDSSDNKPGANPSAADTAKGKTKSDSLLDRLVQGQKKPELDKVNPKLDSFLNQLIQAQKDGQAESFVRRGNIELKKGSVWVIIEFATDDAEAVTLAASKIGAEQLRPGSIGKLNSWAKALVPVAGLDTLANEKSIQFIRLPSNPIEEQ